MVLQEGGLSITITTLTDVAAFLVGWYGVPVLLRGLCVGQVVQRSSLVQEYVHVWVRHLHHSQCLIPHPSQCLIICADWCCAQSGGNISGLFIPGGPIIHRMH